MGEHVLACNCCKYQKSFLYTPFFISFELFLSDFFYLSSLFSYIYI